MAAKVTQFSKRCEGVSRPSPHLEQRGLGRLPILCICSLRSLCKVSILVTTLIPALLRASRFLDNFLLGTGRRPWVNQPFCTMPQTLAWAAAVPCHSALTIQHWKNNKAGSAPIKGVVEPGLASSSAFSLPRKSICPTTQRMVTLFPWFSRSDTADLVFRQHHWELKAWSQKSGNVANVKLVGKAPKTCNSYPDAIFKWHH